MMNTDWDLNASLSGNVNGTNGDGELDMNSIFQMSVPGLSHMNQGNFTPTFNNVNMKNTNNMNTTSMNNMSNNVNDANNVYYVSDVNNLNINNNAYVNNNVNTQNMNNTLQPSTSSMQDYSTQPPAMSNQVSSTFNNKIKSIKEKENN